MTQNNQPDDIIFVTEHIEIHPMASSTWYAVVRDGAVVAKFPTLAAAQARAQELAAA